MRRKALSALLALMLCVSLLAACSSGENSGQAQQDSQQSSSGGSEPDEPPPVGDDIPTQSEQQPGQPAELDDKPKSTDPEPEPAGPSPELLALLDSIVYYGDNSQCRLTGEQAAAYAKVIRQETGRLLADARLRLIGESPEVGAYAALFDAGDGIPALFFGGGAMHTFVSPVTGAELTYWATVGMAGIWQYQDRQTLPYAPEGMEPGGYWGQQLVLRDGHLFIGGQIGSDGTAYNAGVYPLTGGAIPTTPLTSAGYELRDIFVDGDYRYTVDGAETSQEEFEAWQNQWEQQTDLCGHYWGGGAEGSFDGLGDAAVAAEALTQYAAGVIVSEAGTPTQPYGQAYAQKIQELVSADLDPYLNLTFGLVYIDEDDIPELLVERGATDASWFSLYTFAENELYTLTEDLPVNIRAYLGYFPGENLVEFSSSALKRGQMVETITHYQINAVHQWEERSAPEGTSAEMQYLSGPMTGAEILAYLGS